MRLTKGIARGKELVAIKLSVRAKAHTTPERDAGAEAIPAREDSVACHIRARSELHSRPEHRVGPNDGALAKRCAGAHGRAALDCRAPCEARVRAKARAAAERRAGGKMGARSKVRAALEMGELAKCIALAEDGAWVEDLPVPKHESASKVVQVRVRLCRPEHRQTARAARSGNSGDKPGCSGEHGRQGCSSAESTPPHVSSTFLSLSGSHGWKGESQRKRKRQGTKICPKPAAGPKFTRGCSAQTDRKGERERGKGDTGQGAMAASKSFSFEERDESVLESSKVTLAPGSVPDFESFGAIDLGAVSPAIGVLEPGAAAYKPMSKGHEYIFDEEEKTRTFGEHLVFYTGAAYLSGGAPPPWRAARCLRRARVRY